MKLSCPKVPLKEISAYLTLLEGGKPEDKLECEFFLHKFINCEKVLRKFYQWGVYPV